MNSEMIVVLVLTAAAIAGLIYLEMHSRRNKRSAEDRSQTTDGE
jgi:hypothetical protein